MGRCTPLLVEVLFMKILKDKILEKVKSLLEDSENLWANQQFYDDRFDKLVFGTLSILRITYGEKSEPASQILQAKDLYLKSGNHGRYLHPLLNIIKGILTTLSYEVDNDLTGSLEVQAQGEVLGDFILLAKLLLSENNIAAASVLAAGSLEDTLKKFALNQNLEVYDKDLSVVINVLKANGFIKGAQSGIVQSYVQFRNKAFHAQFDKIEAPEVSSVLAFVEQFLLTNFK